MTLHFINKVLETGISPDTNQGIKPRIKVINSACLIGIVATIVANTTMYFTGTFSWYLCITFSLVFTLPVLLNYLQYFSVSTLLLFLGAIFAINWTMISTPDKILYYFVPVAVLPYFFHGKIKRIGFLILLLVLPFIVAKVFNLNYYEPGEFRFAYFFISLGTIIFMVMLFLKIKTENLNLTIDNVEEIEATKTMISNRKRKLEYLNHKLSKQNTELENLVYIASHDLKEPIRNTISYIQLLHKKNSANLSSTQIAEIKELEQNAYKINETITELLSYSQIGKVSDFEEFNLETLLVECIVIIEKKFSRSLQVTHESNLNIYGNREDIKILFVELLSNAIKSNPDKPDLKFQIKANQLGQTMMCTFSDNGKGIPEEDIDKIHQMFFKDLKRNSAAGFGIAICKKIIYYHKGKMHFENNPEGGLSIHFTLNILNPVSN